MKRPNVLLLKGGWSVEREISLKSAAHIVGHLLKNFNVTEFDCGNGIKLGDIDKLVSVLKGVDVVFNILHGRYGEDGMMQSILDFLDVPYVFSGRLSSSICMDKPITKDILLASGFLVCDHRVLTFKELKNIEISEKSVLKPTNEGSSIGVHILNDTNDLKKKLKENTINKESIYMLEPYIKGREVSVVVRGTQLGYKGDPASAQAIGCLEIITKHEFNDYESKYKPGESEHIYLDKDSDMAKQLMEISEQAFMACRCHGVARVDFRIDTEDDNTPYIVELNTQPGMTPTSILPDVVEKSGYGMENLLKWLVENPICRS